MTLYGIDVSNHQGNFDFAAAKREGFVFASHKVTEGDGYKDPYWPRAREQMAEHFPGLFGGYVFCRKASHPEREADLLLAHLGDPKVPVQLDYEDTTGGGDINDLRARIAAIEARGMRVFANYLPRWFWRDRMRSPNLAGTPPLWNSNYIGGTGFASTLYETSPATVAAGWAPFHDGAPNIEILQFTEKARVAGQQIDANAYRGDINQLRALFGGGRTEGAPVADTPQLILDQLVGPGGQGWEILGRSKVDPSRNNTLVEAVAEVREALLKPRPSIINGEVAFDLPTNAQLIDASTYRTEEMVKKVLDKLEGK
ncbi:hypothetical protein CH276_18860 [Rhodococcus sp. 06-470-2]|uniref:glycoside hydrolase family 25 protein n=1 Tax=unclassified Rhodococcus (in: high G+C Gram-positive bacteria) TaxID=192944 RepID=UPI000B9AC7BD|nr:MULTISPECIES: glycoside hydrolase family 25 protein [unclassified Rhodococcus (in: high G+C Gram-positive bacteria)]OZC60038.1 hypothetical protein CH276_18860 [Rhodococcus sp. 06-470-2]OZE56972.1 hypothetical protein CH265_24605 [Rhodococcus sp. 05-2221-1B]